MTSGVLGICVNFNSFLLIKLTSGIYTKLLVQARNAGLVLYCILMGERYTNLEVLAYVITLVSFTIYSIIQVRKPKDVSEASKAEDSEVLMDGNTHVAEDVTVPFTTASEVDQAAEASSSKVSWRRMMLGNGMALVLSIPARLGMDVPKDAGEVSVTVEDKPVHKTPS
eukprot:TRINITY_DN20184_c0_g1_i5.p2 TRINITY_DN20184_c0_g1~~TRINITY_DN20184_c0_g1_i5.p2  ORF type:complete len:168 (+),score=28.66 TRINITY_DN20184_c0_g1_i5:919-1422(+)